MWMMPLMLLLMVEHLKSLKFVKFSECRGHGVVHGQVGPQPMEVLK